MHKLSSFEAAVPVLAAAMACATVKGSQSGSPNSAESVSDKGMIGPRAPHEITACVDSGSFFAAIEKATLEARLDLAEKLGDVEYIETDAGVEEFTTETLRYPTMIDHEFRDGIHRVCVAANPPGQLPKELTPLTPQEIGNSGLRRALSQVKLPNGKTPRHMGTQPGGERVVCVAEIKPGNPSLLDTAAKNQARHEFREDRDGVHIRTSDEKKVQHAAAATRLKKRESSSAGVAHFSNVSGIATANGEDGKFRCGVASDSEL